MTGRIGCSAAVISSLRSSFSRQHARCYGLGDPGPSTILHRRLSTSTFVQFPRQKPFGLRSNPVAEVVNAPGATDAELDVEPLEEEDFFELDTEEDAAAGFSAGDGRDFKTVVSDLKRRKRKDEAKRLQRVRLPPAATDWWSS